MEKVGEFLQELKVIAKGAGWIFAGFFASKLLAFIYRVIIARFLEPSDLGLFSMGLAVLGIMTVFAGLGLYQGVLHFVAIYESRGKSGELRGTILGGLKMQLLASCFFAALMFFLSKPIALSFFRQPLLEPILQALSFVIPFQVITSNLITITLAFKKAEYRVLLRNLVENIAKIVFTAGFLLLGLRAFGVSLALALSSVFILLVSIYVLNKKVYRFFAPGAETKYRLGELFSYSWPLFAVGFFSIIMSSLDTICLGLLTTAYDTGIYSVAIPTARVLLAPSFAFISIFLPIATGLYAQGKTSELSKTYKTVVRWVFLVLFPSMLFTVFFSREILSILFGAVYAEGAAALSILAIAIFIEGLFGPVGSMLECISKTRWILFNTIVASVLNVVLNFLFIPLFAKVGAAVTGAALATAIAYFLWGLLAFIEVYAATRIHPYNAAYLKPTIASVIAIVLFYALKQLFPPIDSFTFPLKLLLLLFLGIAFSVVYALILLVIKGLQKEDIEILKAMENKTGVRVEFIRNIVKKFI